MFLNGNHEAIFIVVNMSSSVDSKHTVHGVSVILKCGRFGSGRGLVEAEKLPILSGFEIRCPVVAKDEVVGVSTASSFVIMLSDDIVI